MKSGRCCKYDENKLMKKLSIDIGIDSDSADELTASERVVKYMGSKDLPPQSERGSAMR